jgi:saccharopine dehydrogenase (NAD+, L-lysine-forming)
MAKRALGIRREDKNRWERRVPLTPADARQLIAQGYDVVIQPSPIRIFPDAAWVAAGARVEEDLSGCAVVLGVKEMPASFFRKDGVYVFFAHVVKGQKYNMPMLKTLLAQRAGLVDYEKIADDQGRRLVFFGRHAGLAGAIDTLWAAGRRLQTEGLETPLAALEPAHRYRELDDAKRALAAAGAAIRERGLPPSLVPFVAGITGYGHVGRGAMEVFDALGAQEVSAAELPRLFEPGGADPRTVYRVTFKEEHTVEPLAAGAKFELPEFFQHPERYRGVFAKHVPRLTLLVNCVYWDAKYPRLVTKAGLQDLWSREKTPRLRVIGDVTCDILGSIECNVKTTSPDAPVYVWDPDTDRATDGVQGRGPVVLAVDNLPCELPAEASASFGEALMPFVPRLLEADWSQPFEKLGLPRELADAVVAHRGELTPRYAYIAGLW